ncbi:MAG TPA: cellulase family glycosylhydrolase [Burkholderiaceae bacterium]|nr:cellulase family glycosylhydrolase [Burkholderiaceae bacterium]
MENRSRFVLLAAASLLGALSACGGGSGSASDAATGATATGSMNAARPVEQVALAHAGYSVTAGAGPATLGVARTNGSRGTVSVAYTTVDGTAIAGTDYTPASGTLTWASGDNSPKTISVPVAATASSSRSFSVKLSNPLGATLGSTARATVTILASSPAAGGTGTGSTSTSGGATTGSGSTPVASTTGLSLRVAGNRLIDAAGNTVQLRGVNVSGLESVAIQGWDPANPWGGATGVQPDGSQTPPWATMVKNWAVNAVRLPLNEASWLGLTCTDIGGAGSTVTGGVQAKNAAGASVHADPGGNYRATVEASVANATAAGLYVILDLHWAAPGAACPYGQNPMADADHSLAFWTSVASTFKNDPNVVFEAFNEPFMFWLSPSTTNPWTALLHGATVTQLYTFGTPYQVAQTWQTAGMQQLVDAIRAAGATNVILTSGLAWSGDLSGWLANKPNDPLNQLGAVWHAYPGYGAAFGTAAYLQPNNAQGNIWTQVQGILAAGVPVVITEFGDHNAAGTTSAPFASNLLNWADANGVSYLGWTWDVWQNPDFVLISDAAGDPSPGYGEYVKAHYLCRASGNANCTAASGGPAGGTTTGSTTGSTTSSGATSGAGTTSTGTTSTGTTSTGTSGTGTTKSGSSTSSGTTTASTGASSGASSTGGTSTASGSTSWVYYNGAFNWPGDYSYAATPNYADSTGAPLSGSKDILVTLTSAWGAWQPYAANWSFDSTPYTKLTFALKPTVANQRWSIQFIKVGDVPVGISLNVANYGPAPVVGQWAVYTIPLSDLGVLGTSIYKFAIQDQTGLSSNAWYVDNVGFQ